ncbi:hypothetical protein [Parachryseolinea silvisoli]|uniref:hypothetical protein n=1 Tax=Parachryseolinea silvisoli TaxID=2873601 RepID=UPI002265DD90|nr:hypothetical protein [Parachryseolinea silvisoli]MCD9015217.1 hypothetical protein [Parachryseolinea silvisoli]
MELLSTNDHLTISYERDTKILICKWHNHQSVESIRYNGALILEAFKHHGASKVLNDNLDVEGQWEGAIDWTIHHWFPAMTNAGLKHFAWVLSKDIFARVSAKRAGEQFDSVRFFRSYRYAHDWLSQIH